MWKAGSITITVISELNSALLPWTRYTQNMPNWLAPLKELGITQSPIRTTTVVRSFGDQAVSLLIMCRTPNAGISWTFIVYRRRTTELKLLSLTMGYWVLWTVGQYLSGLLWETYEILLTFHWGIYRITLSVSWKSQWSKWQEPHGILWDLFHLLHWILQWSSVGFGVLHPMV